MVPSDLVAAAVDLLFPPRCVACGKTGGPFCSICAASVRAPEMPVCFRCGVSLAGVDRASGTTLCSTCRTSVQPPALDALRVAALYEGAIRQVLLALKFHRQRRAAQPLGRLLVACATEAGWGPDLIVPVPLSPMRLAERGYNQAELLARFCGRRLGVPVRLDLVRRTRNTTPQTHLSREERHQNVAGAFAMVDERARRAIAGGRVLLIDDVTTTGSTLEAAARALRSGAPEVVWGLAVARPTLGGELTLPTLAARHGSPALSTHASRGRRR